MAKKHISLQKMKKWLRNRKKKEEKKCLPNTIYKKIKAKKCLRNTIHKKIEKISKKHNSPQNEKMAEKHNSQKKKKKKKKRKNV